MWYEILPSAGIILVAMTFPHASAYVINKLVLGNMYRRGMVTGADRYNYTRDRRLAGGNPYKVVGLEAIPNK
ncbi:NADH dehydrogenase [ubiquinone] 1 alpha subcomplex subunit 1-like [Onthophagus taurus]|uniref:NADH dehydrogenase [ubiquinone] 1 alpha subcomplex subunit 1-like n=1 Tax=Onthophagus taurus TaxID=166361 RepID=UPI0039BE0571